MWRQDSAVAVRPDDVDLSHLLPLDEPTNNLAVAEDAWMALQEELDQAERQPASARGV